jgi:hypothetical protein
LSPTATSCSTNGPHWPFSPSTINCCKLNNGQTTLLKDLNFHYIRVQSKFKYCIVGIYYLQDKKSLKIQKRYQEAVIPMLQRKTTTKCSYRFSNI